MKKLMILFSLFCIITSCEQKIENEKELMYSSVSQSNSFYYDELKYLCENLPEFDGRPFEIAEESEYSTGLNKYDTPMLKIVQFVGGGYAVVSNKEIDEPILAIIPSGSYSPVNAQNEGPVVFLANAEQFVNNCSYNPLNDCKPEDFYLERVNSLLKTKWGQYDIYNDYCPNQYPAGCIPIAAAQVSCYYRTPESFENPLEPHETLYLDWAEMDKQGINSLQDPLASDLGKFIRFVGGKCGAEYHKSGTSCQHDDLPHYFNGYTSIHCSQFHSYAFKNIRKYLDNEDIVIMSGSDLSAIDEAWNWVIDKRSGGHSWLIDGYIINHKCTYSQIFVHCNWGWTGSCDGYYFSTCFDSNNMPVAPNSPQKAQAYYKYRLEYAIPNIGAYSN